MPRLPDLDDPCGRHFTFRDFVECGETWQRTQVDNTPAQIETYEALRLLAESILDPVAAEFGHVSLTYGVSCHALSKTIPSRIAPYLDQHASYELTPIGKRICERGGAACDFEVANVDSLGLAQWVVQNTPFDRLYFYGADCPIHVSAAVSPNRKCVIVSRHESTGRVIPRSISVANFVQLHS